MKQNSVILEFNFYGYYGGGMAGSVYDKMGLSPTILANGGGNSQPMIFEIYET